MAKEWYVLRVQSGREESVKEALAKKVALAGLDGLVSTILVPKERITEIKAGRRRVRERKLYPGYIMVEMDLTDDVWFLIRDTAGIGDFVGGYQRPVPMAPAEVEKLLASQQQKEEAPEVRIDLRKGESVKIKEGPFENFDGVVDEVFPSRGQVKVIVTIFGRPTPVELEYWQVERI